MFHFPSQIPHEIRRRRIGGLGGGPQVLPGKKRAARALALPAGGARHCPPPPWIRVQERSPSSLSTHAAGEGGRAGAAPSRAGFRSMCRLEKNKAAARRDKGARAELDPPGALCAAVEDTPPPPWTRACRDLLGADPPMRVPSGPICLGPRRTGGLHAPRFRVAGEEPL